MRLVPHINNDLGTSVSAAATVHKRPPTTPSRQDSETSDEEMGAEVLVNLRQGSETAAPPTQQPPTSQSTTSTGFRLERFHSISSSGPSTARSSTTTPSSISIQPPPPSAAHYFQQQQKIASFSYPSSARARSSTMPSSIAAPHQHPLQPPYSVISRINKTGLQIATTATSSRLDNNNEIEEDDNSDNNYSNLNTPTTPQTPSKRARKYGFGNKAMTEDISAGATSSSASQLQHRLSLKQSIMQRQRKLSLPAPVPVGNNYHHHPHSQLYLHHHHHHQMSGRGEDSLRMMNEAEEEEDGDFMSSQTESISRSTPSSPKRASSVRNAMESVSSISPLNGKRKMSEEGEESGQQLMIQNAYSPVAKVSRSFSVSSPGGGGGSGQHHQQQQQQQALPAPPPPKPKWKPQGFNFKSRHKKKEGFSSTSAPSSAVSPGFPTNVSIPNTTTPTMATAMSAKTASFPPPPSLPQQPSSHYSYRDRQENGDDAEEDEEDDDDRRRRHHHHHHLYSAASSPSLGTPPAHIRIGVHYPAASPSSASDFMMMSPSSPSPSAASPSFRKRKPSKQGFGFKSMTKRISVNTSGAPPSSSSSPSLASPDVLSPTSSIAEQLRHNLQLRKASIAAASVATAAASTTTPLPLPHRMQEITSEDEDEDEEAEDRKRRRSTLKRRSTTSSSSRQRISATERPSIVNLHVRFADSADSSSVEGDESTNTTKPSTSSSPLWRKPGNISISTASPTYSSPAAARSPATNQRLISEQLKQNLRQKAETQQTNQQVRSNLLLKIQRTNSTSSSLSPISYVSSPKSASASIPPPSSARPTHHTDEMDEEVGGGDDEEEEVGSATSSTMPPMSSVSRKPSKQKYGFGRRASSQVSSPMSPQIRARIAESLKNSAIVKE